MADTSFMIGATRWPGISKLIEEAGEVVQVCGKLLATQGETQHWDGPPLDERLADELGDLLAAIYFVREHCPVSADAIEQRALDKLRLFEKWHSEQLAKDGA